MKLHLPGGNCNLSACFFDICSYSSEIKCIFVGLFDQSLLRKKKVEPIWLRNVCYKNALARGSGILLCLDKAACYFVQHAPNLEMI